MAKKRRPEKRPAKKTAKSVKKSTASKMRRKPAAKTTARKKTSPKKPAAKSGSKGKTVAPGKRAASKKAAKATGTGRRELGARIVGEPIWELKAATAVVLAEPEFQGVRGDAIDYYFEKFLMGFLPQTLDDALSDTELAKLSPATVREASFLLLGHMIRKLHRQLNPDAADDQTGWWQEKLLVRLAEVANVPAETYVAGVLEIKNRADEATQLIERVAHSIGLSPHSLFMLHEMMIEVVEEDVLDA